MKFVEGTRSFQGTAVYTKDAALESFRAAAAVARKPFIYLSAGVSNAEFTESLELAAESGVEFAGVLCGRATWKDGIPVYSTRGGDAFREWLETDGVRNIGNVNEALRGATSWFAAYGRGFRVGVRAVKRRGLLPGWLGGNRSRRLWLPGEAATAACDVESG